MSLSQLYAPPLGLLTDLYQLTMAEGYLAAGMADREASFSLFFRECPFGGGFAIACGLEDAVDWLEHLAFSDSDLAYLAGLTGADGKRLLSGRLLSELRRFELRCDVLAVPEGTVVFPREPLLRVTGPLLQAQLVESALLTLVNFQSLVATKATRICRAARGTPVLEFGLRRAQGIDGALSASRAAYVGGCAATSNVMAGKRYGIPVRGTHAHSWVMAFGDEREAFLAYAEALPGNCVFLVDTYDTLSGVRHAIQVGLELRQRGHELVGIRLDSGDPAALATAARELLDQAGFPEAAIFASGDLDEHLVSVLKERGAPIDWLGVGTRLVTAYDQPALGGVYKLGAMRADDGAWSYRLKLSNEPAKATLPGLLQTRRYRGPGGFLGDAIFDAPVPPGSDPCLVDPVDEARTFAISGATSHEDLLVPVLAGGRRVGRPHSIERARARVAEQLAGFSESELLEPHRYPVGLEETLHRLKTHLMSQSRSA